MRNKILPIGLFVALICPAVLFVGFGLWSQMPHCGAGDSGPAKGCVLLGINLNWLIDLTVLSFVGAFFLVPIGLLTMLIGAFLYKPR